MILLKYRKNQTESVKNAKQFYYRNSGNTIILKLGLLKTVFRAEVTAINDCADYAE